MDWWAVWRHFIAAVFIAVLTTVERVTVATARAANSCPENYWDEPSKRCSRPLIGLLDHLLPADSPANWSLTDQSAINRTCSSWHTTNNCYQRLLDGCRYNEKAVRELEMHLQRYSTYALTCHISSLRKQRRLFDCFLPHAMATSTCTEAFDTLFRNHVSDKQYRNACRVVSTALKCFHEIQLEMVTDHRCTTDGRLTYQRLYIQPLVDQTREIVINNCDISPTYEQYMTSSATATVTTRCDQLRTNTVLSTVVVGVLASSFNSRRYTER